jgi:hypothetical protein
MLFARLMMTRYLFPHRFKWVGWVLVVVSATLGLLDMTGTYQLPALLSWLPPLVGSHDPFFTDTTKSVLPRENTDLYAMLLILGGLLAACSRERYEDEYISKIRLDSLLWALYAYYVLLALAFVLVSGLAFFMVMLYAMFAPLLLFMVRFELVLRLSARSLPYEK